MIWHHNLRFNSHAEKMLWNLNPTFFDGLPNRGEDSFVLLDAAKKAPSAVC
jgi:hypothetical protein